MNRPSQQRPAAKASLATLLQQAIARRKRLLDSAVTDVFRVFGGEADGMDGLYIDVYGSGAVLIEYEGRAGIKVNSEAGRCVLDGLWKLGVRAVYHKPFARDRSRLGGKLPDVVTRAAPLAGEPLPEAITVTEHGVKLEIRLYDGLSTGLFLDQRENRAWVAAGVKRRVSSGGTPAVLNTFAYTCAFSAAAAKAGAATTSVDVSGRYLDWGKRNFELNGIDPATHRFAKMDTFEFFGYARRKNLRYDLIILDPPSFSAGSKKKGVPVWSSTEDYGRLITEAAQLLTPGGVIFASTNTTELCRPGRLAKLVTTVIPNATWLDLPPMPSDFENERERFSAVAFRVN